MELQKHLALNILRTEYRPKEFEPDVRIEYFLCDASLKIHDLIAFATKKHCRFWKPVFPWMVHPKSQTFVITKKIRLIIAVTQDLRSCEIKAWKKFRPEFFLGFNFTSCV